MIAGLFQSVIIPAFFLSLFAENLKKGAFIYLLLVGLFIFILFQANSLTVGNGFINYWKEAVLVVTPIMAIWLQLTRYFLRLVRLEKLMNLF